MLYYMPTCLILQTKLSTTFGKKQIVLRLEPIFVFSRVYFNGLLIDALCSLEITQLNEVKVRNLFYKTPFPSCHQKEFFLLGISFCPRLVYLPNLHKVFRSPFHFSRLHISSSYSFVQKPGFGKRLAFRTRIRFPEVSFAFLILLLQNLGAAQ